MKHVTLFCIVFASLSILPGCKRHESTTTSNVSVSSVNAATTILARLTPDEKPDSDPATPHKTPKGSNELIVIEMSRNGTGSAYIARDNAGVHVTHNGKKGKNYKGIDASTLTLSPDGKRVAYSVFQSDKWFLVVDDKEYGPYDDKGGPVFSPDSRHVAFEAKSGATWRIVSDTGVSGEFENTTGKPQFSYDSSKIMYIAESQKNGYELFITDLTFKVLAKHAVSTISLIEDPTLKSVYLVDKMDSKNFQVLSFPYDLPTQIIKHGIYPEIYNPKVSPDGKRLSFLARIKGDNYLVLDTKTVKIPAGGIPQSPYFLPDGSIGVVIEGLNGTFPLRLFSENKFIVPSKYKEVSDLATTVDGKQHAYLAIKNEQFIIVCNGIEGPVYDRVTMPQFSPDGKYLVYRARKNNRRFVVVADPATNRVISEHPGNERVFETTFTQDGRSVAYGAKDGNTIFWKVEKLP